MNKFLDRWKDPNRSKILVKEKIEVMNPPLDNKHYTNIKQSNGDYPRTALPGSSE